MNTWGGAGPPRSQRIAGSLLAVNPTTASAAAEQEISFVWTEHITPARRVRTILLINDVDGGSEDWAYQVGNKERYVLRAADWVAESHGLGTHVFSVQLVDEDGNATEVLTVDFTIQ